MPPRIIVTLESEESSDNDIIEDKTDDESCSEDSDYSVDLDDTDDESGSDDDDLDEITAEELIELGIDYLEIIREAGRRYRLPRP